MEVKQESEDWIELSTKEGSTVLALYPSRDKKKPSNVKQGLDDGRSTLIGFNVSDLDSVCKELENRGVSFFKRPAEESFGKHAIIEDPEGNLISIAEMNLRMNTLRFRTIMDLHRNKLESIRAFTVEHFWSKSTRS